MVRIKCIVSYDGTGFSGFQVQPNQRTVQSEIESVLASMHKGEHVRITASGRTDAGVHAHGQVFHFDTNLSIEPESWKKALNAQLPDDLFIKDVEAVPSDFHARFDVRKKEYRYRILRSADEDVFRRHYTYHFPYPLDLGLIREAASVMIGEHDFTAYCSAKSEVIDKIRNVYAIDILEEGDELVFRFEGNGFLYNMVRLLTGDLLRAGQGKLKSSEIAEMLSTQKRSISGLNVPGSGLYLWEVSY